MRTVPIRLYAYSCLVLAIQADGSGRKEATYRFRVIARTAAEAESIGIELARTSGETRDLIATVSKVECLRGCHQLQTDRAG